MSLEAETAVVLASAKASDAVIAGYFCFATLVLAIFASHTGSIELALLNFAILAVLCLVIWLDGRHHRPSSDFLHSWFPIAFVLVGYFEIAPMVAQLHPHHLSYDGQLRAIDLYVANPAAFVAHHASRGWAEVLTLCYASYFFLPLILAAALYSQRTAFNRAMTTVALAFAVNFTFYLAIPAFGPNRASELKRPPELEGYFFAGPIQHVLARMEGHTQDAFPSGHTLVTLLVLALAWQTRRTLFWIFLPIGSGLIVATIYLRYHYLADFASSVVLAPLCLQGGERLSARWRLPS